MGKFLRDQTSRLPVQKIAVIPNDYRQAPTRSCTTNLAGYQFKRSWLFRTTTDKILHDQSGRLPIQNIVVIPNRYRQNPARPIWSATSSKDRGYPEPLPTKSCTTNLVGYQFKRSWLSRTTTDKILHDQSGRLPIQNIVVIPNRYRQNPARPIWSATSSKDRGYSERLPTRSCTTNLAGYQFKISWLSRTATDKILHDQSGRLPVQKIAVIPNH
nr:uncharacterized protein LOC115267230 [Aedes albopictus]